jgi:signal transduction histidine kinase
MLCLRIHDDGDARPSAEALRQDLQEGVGIAGMRGRLKALGGRLTLASKQKGFSVLAEVPLPCCDGSGGPIPV